MPAQINPSDFFLDTMTIDQRSEDLNLKSTERLVRLENEWNNVGGQSQCLHEIKEIVTASAPISSTETSPAGGWNSFFHEFPVLLQRSFSDELRDKGTIGATVGQSVINVLLLGSIYWQIQLDAKGKK
jgi:hypothetical protein